MHLTETTRCDVMLTQNDFRFDHDIHIHGHSMSSLYALEDNDPVLNRTTGNNHKINVTVLEYSFVLNEVMGSVKSKPEFV